MNKPEWYEEVRQIAISDWDFTRSREITSNMLDSEFRDLQDVSQVVSELLQNADDVNATKVSVRIESGNTFVFEHNGDDFTRENFLSLCNFARSSKKTVKSIGCHGVGFKTGFSIGPTVCLRTLLLSVKFDEEKFFIPEWIELEPPQNGFTTRITIKFNENNEDNIKDIYKSFEDWRNNFESVLFFRNISELSVQGHVVKKEEISQGPIDKSTINHLSSAQTGNNILCLHFETDPLPEKVVTELQKIRKNEKKEDLQKLTFECDIVSNTNGDNTNHRIYAVLPALFHFHLPFSINGPFYLNKERTNLVNPRKSPINTWLLETVARYCSKSIKDILNNKELPISERLLAYILLPEQNISSQAPAEEIILNEMKKSLEDTALLIDIDGNVVEKGIVINPKLYEIYDTAAIKQLYRQSQYPVIARELAENERYLHQISKYTRNAIIRESNDSFIKRFTIDRNTTVPAPNTYEKIGLLWRYLNAAYAEEIKSNAELSSNIWPRMQLFPYKNDSYLHAVCNCFFTTDDFEKLPITLKEFITDRIVLVTKDVLQNIDECCKAYQAIMANFRDETTELNSSDLLKKLVEKEVPYGDWLTLTHIAFLLDAQVPQNFKYQNGNGEFVSTNLYYNLNNILEKLSIPEEEIKNLTLNSKYFDLCATPEERERFNQWICSSKSNILLPFKLKRTQKGDYINDISLIQKCLQYQESEEDKERFWCFILLHIIKIDENSKQHVFCNPKEKIPASWIETFKSVPCLLGEDKVPHKPSELYLKSQNIVFSQLDTFVSQIYGKLLSKDEAKNLFVALGVNTKPGYPEYEIELLKSYTQAKPQHTLILDLLKKIDQIYQSSTKRIEIINALNSFNSAYTENQSFCSPKVVYAKNTALFETIQIPDVEFLHQSIANLDIWKEGGINIKVEPEIALIKKYVEDGVSLINQEGPKNSIPHEDIIKFFKTINNISEGLPPAKFPEIKDILRNLSVLYTDENSWEEIGLVYRNKLVIPTGYRLHHELSYFGFWDKLGIIKNSQSTDEVLLYLNETQFKILAEANKSENYPEDVIIDTYTKINELFKYCKSKGSGTNKILEHLGTLPVYCENKKWVEFSLVYKNNVNIPDYAVLHPSIVNFDIWENIKEKPDDKDFLQYVSKTIDLFNSNRNLTTQEICQKFETIEFIHNDRSLRGETVDKLDVKIKKLKFAYTADEAWHEIHKVYREKPFLPDTWQIHPNLSNLKLWTIKGNSLIRPHPSRSEVAAYLETGPIQELHNLAITNNQNIDEIYPKYQTIEKYYRYNLEGTKNKKDPIIDILQKVKVFTINNTWTNCNLIYLKSTDIPNTYQIHQKIANLVYWKDCNIKDKPEDEDYLQYLETLKENSVIPSTLHPRVKKLLNRNFEEIIKHGHWISLNYHWISLQQFKYYLNDLTKIDNLYEKWESSVANLSIIHDESQDEVRDFLLTHFQRRSYNNTLKNLLESIGWKIQINGNEHVDMIQDFAWIRHFGNYCIDNIPANFDKAREYKEFGEMLCSLSLHIVESFKNVPYLKNVNNEEIADGNDGIVRLTQDGDFYLSLAYSEDEVEDEIEKELFDKNVEELKGLFCRCIGKSKAEIESKCNGHFNKRRHSQKKEDEIQTNIYDNEQNPDEEESISETAENYDADSQNNFEHNESTNETPNSAWIDRDSNDTGDKDTIDTGIISRDSINTTDNFQTTSDYSESETLENTTLHDATTTGCSFPPKYSYSSPSDERNSRIQPSRPKSSTNVKLPKSDGKKGFNDLLNERTKGGGLPSISNTVAIERLHTHSSNPEMYGKIAATQQQIAENAYTPNSHRKTIKETVWREPTTEERAYLNARYHGECQLCHNTFPKYISDNQSFDFIYYATNIFKSSELSEARVSTENMAWNTLCLCPTCSHRFKNRSVFPPEFDSDHIKLTTINSFEHRGRDDGSEQIVVPIRILGKDKKEEFKELFLDPNHFSMILEVFKRLAEADMDTRYTMNDNLALSRDKKILDNADGNMLSSELNDDVESLKEINSKLIPVNNSISIPREAITYPSDIKAIPPGILETLDTLHIKLSKSDLSYLVGDQSGHTLGREISLLYKKTMGTGILFALGEDYELRGKFPLPIVRNIIMGLNTKVNMGLNITYVQPGEYFKISHLPYNPNISHNT